MHGTESLQELMPCLPRKNGRDESGKEGGSSGREKKQQCPCSVRAGR